MKELDRLANECARQIYVSSAGQEGMIRLIRSAIDQALALSREEIIEECAKVCEDYSAKKWTGYKTGNGPERANPHVQGESCGADDCATAIRALVHSTGVPSEQRASSKAERNA